MTQEEKQLLLIDLCARLPYGVKIHGPKENDDILWELDYNMDIKKIVDDGWLPYLRPMSSMTEEERKEFSIFIGKTETYIQKICLDSDSMVNPIIGGFKCVYWGLFDKCVDWLNAHHFDYRGLITIGLALEAPI